MAPSIPGANVAKKDDGAMLTIGELSAKLGLPTHILRYWETKFAQLSPLQRSGNRRYYRPADVALAMRINALLNERGFTIKGAQQELAKGNEDASLPIAPVATTPAPAAASVESKERGAIDISALRSIRNRLQDALAAA